MSSPEHETGQSQASGESAEGERGTSPVFESPASSGDEASDLSDVDGLDLVGCTACGESFENVDDLRNHQTQNCTGLGAGDKYCGSPTTSAQMDVQQGQPEGHIDKGKTRTSEPFLGSAHSNSQSMPLKNVALGGRGEACSKVTVRKGCEPKNSSQNLVKVKSELSK